MFRVWSSLLLSLCLLPPCCATPIRSGKSPVKTTATQITYLSPNQLRGQIAFVRQNDLWVVDPRTRGQHLLLRDKDIRENYSLAISPELNRVFVGGDEGKITIRSLDSKILLKFQIKASFPRPGDPTDKTPYVYPGGVSFPRWSPDGKRIAYTVATGYIEGGNDLSSSEVRVINADGTNDHHIEGTTLQGGLSAARPVWSRDGKRLLFSYGPAYDPEVPEQKVEYRTAAIDGSDIRPFDGDMSSFDDITVSRDGKKVVDWEEWNGNIVLTLHSLPRTSGKTSDFLGNMAYEIAGFSLAKNEAAFSPDGKQVVFEGTLNATFIDPNGHLVFPSYPQYNPHSVVGLFITQAGVDKPQLVVKDAVLLKWL